MKHLTGVLLAAALAALIVQPITTRVNNRPGNSGTRADGGPMPPLPPPPPQAALVA